MHLTLSPTCGLPGQPETMLHVAGDVLSIDGTPYDLSPVPEGGEGEWADSPIIGKITRQGGVLQVTLLVVLDDTALHNQPDSPWTIHDASGTVAIPALRKTEEMTA